MTTQYGVTPAGFVTKPLQEILKEINTDVLAINPEIDVGPEEPLGQLNGIMAAKLSDVWQLAEVAYNGTNRGDAEDDLLDNVGGLTGTTRLGPSESSVYCAVAMSVAGTYAIGALVAFITAVPAVKFANAVAIVAPSLVGGVAISPSNPFLTVVLYKSEDDGPDAGNALIAANAAAGIGPSPITPGVLTGMVPVTGWLSVGDIAGPTLGTLEETDDAYRVRQLAELSAPGACTVDAIGADILRALSKAPTPVVGATVKMYENTSLLTDANGLPPKSFMAVVFDGLSPNTAQDDPIIGQTIWDGKPSGMQTFGSTTVTAFASDGTPRLVSFSRPAQIPVYLSVQVAIAPTANPTAVAAAVAEAIIDASQGSPFTLYGRTLSPPADAPTTLTPGQEVIREAFRAIAQGQDGVRDVPAFTLGLAPAPAAVANLPIGEASVAVLSLSTVVVTTVVFTP